MGNELGVIEIAGFTSRGFVCSTLVSPTANDAVATGAEDLPRVRVMPFRKSPTLIFKIRLYDDVDHSICNIVQDVEKKGYGRL